MFLNLGSPGKYILNLGSPDKYLSKFGISKQISFEIWDLQANVLQFGAARQIF